MNYQPMYRAFGFNDIQPYAVGFVLIQSYPLTEVRYWNEQEFKKILFTVLYFYQLSILNEKKSKDRKKKL